MVQQIVQQKGQPFFMPYPKAVYGHAAAVAIEIAFKLVVKSYGHLEQLARC